MTAGRIQGQTPDIAQAGLRQIDLCDHSAVKATIGVGLNAHDPWPSPIQDKEVAAGRIDGHPLRVLKTKRTSIVAEN